MAVAWLSSADKHGIPRDEIAYAIVNATIEREWPPAREGHTAIPRLYVGPSRYGDLEVLVEVNGTDIVIFHAMRLRATTQARIREHES